jgi:hypothetical protein
MAVQRLGRDTTSVDALAWNGTGFGDATADAMWTELSTSLKHIALAELGAGNIPANILRNDTRGIVLLSFQLPPVTPRPNGAAVRVHTSFANGNYCYDGTSCTYEDLESGDFLAFDDPEYVDAL